jgi:hypothetical protein
MLGSIWNIRLDKVYIGSLLLLNLFFDMPSSDYRSWLWDERGLVHARELNIFNGVPADFATYLHATH